LKDLLIVRGIKHHPEEIEATIAASHPIFANGGGAVFAVDEDGAARIVAIHEVDRAGQAGCDPVEPGQAAIAAVVESHGFRPDAIHLVRAGRLPRTTSGKIQRHVCRLQYLAGQLGSTVVA
jgi:acyl-CoA synthetase (AMP-forming)/AMP-acid ligase II